MDTEPCAWCGRPTDRTAETVPGHLAVRDGEKLWIVGVEVPRCIDCARRHIRHNAAFAQARYLRQAQIDDCEQLGLDV